MPYSIVVLGASWGGLAAVGQLLSVLPADLPVPIAMVQHRSRHGDSMLATILQDRTQLRVVDVEDKEPLEPGTVYVAPANYHMLVERGHLSLSTDPLVRFSRPSIDLLFFSAADSYADETIGVVLTGANDDGARGLRSIAERGGAAIVQDPDTAESPTMPRAALDRVPRAGVLKLDDIPAELVRLTAERAIRVP